MYKIEIARSYLKDFKKIPREVQVEVVSKWIPRLQQDPYVGIRLKGPALKKFHKIAFRYKKNDYRIVYLIQNKQITVILLAIGSRENFYKRLKEKL